MYYLLLYDYVEDVIRRRAPFREAHLAHIQRYLDRGELVLGGAFDNPVNGAALAFRTSDRTVVETFARNDPYVGNGIVTAWRVKDWNVVVGTAHEA